MGSGDCSGRGKSIAAVVAGARAIEVAVGVAVDAGVEVEVEVEVEDGGRAGSDLTATIS